MLYWSLIEHKHKTRQWKEQNKISKWTNFQSCTKVSCGSAVILGIPIFIRLCMVNRQALPVQFVCHTKPYKNSNFQIYGASRYFGLWLWQLVHLLILVCSFQWCVLFLCLAKLYRSCPIRDQGLSARITPIKEDRNHSLSKARKLSFSRGVRVGWRLAESITSVLTI